MDKCTVDKCNKEKVSGDAYFCFKCREKWVELCKELGIHEKETEDYNGIYAVLERFQKGLPI